MLTRTGLPAVAEGAASSASSSSPRADPAFSTRRRVTWGGLLAGAGFPATAEVLTTPESSAPRGICGDAGLNAAGLASIKDLLAEAGPELSPELDSIATGPCTGSASFARLIICWIVNWREG